MNGTVIPLSEVPDAVFSSEMLGKGFGVEPSEGKAYAPVDGEVTTVFDTKHALGLMSENGVELLIHKMCIRDSLRTVPRPPRQTKKALSSTTPTSAPTLTIGYRRCRKWRRNMASCLRPFISLTKNPHRMYLRQ